MPNPPWFPKVRKSVKTVDWEAIRKKRIQATIEQRTQKAKARRDALVWKRRTEKYRINIHGVFEGSYYRPIGETIIVRGNTKTKVRYEAVRGAKPLRWIRVPYEAPRS